MTKDHRDKQKHTDSTDLVAPFARIRVIAALILGAIALGVLIFRAFTG